MKALLIINDVTKTIEDVKILNEGLAYAQHLAIRVNNQAGLSMLFLDIKNNVIPDIDKNNVIIYDAGYANEGFHPAVVYENRDEVTLKDYYDIVSPLIINEMIKYFGVDRSRVMLNAIGILEIRTNSKSKVELFIKNLEEQITKNLQSARGGASDIQGTILK